MFIKYRGGRVQYDVTLNRKSYYFNKENKMILDTKDQNVINHIFSLDNRQEFEVVEEEPRQEDQRVILPEILSEQEQEPKLEPNPEPEESEEYKPEPLEQIKKKKVRGRPKRGKNK